MAIMIHDIYQLLRSGRVQRWHTHPDMSKHQETLDEHQWSTAAILLYLDPNASRETIIAALFHDVGELGAGDLSFGFKRDNPKIAAEHRRYEDEFRADIVTFTEDDTKLLKLADWLSGYVTMIFCEPWLRNHPAWRAELDRQIAAAPDRVKRNLTVLIGELQAHCDERNV